MNQRGQFYISEWYSDDAHCWQGRLVKADHVGLMPENKLTRTTHVVADSEILIIGKKRNSKITKSSKDKRKNLLVWLLNPILIGSYPLACLYPARTDWLWRVSSGSQSSFADLQPNGFVDTVVPLVLKYSMWPLLGILGLNVLETVGCFLAVPGCLFVDHFGKRHAELCDKAICQQNLGGNGLMPVSQV